MSSGARTIARATSPEVTEPVGDPDAPSAAVGRRACNAPERAVGADQQATAAAASGQGSARAVAPAPAAVTEPSRYLLAARKAAEAARARSAQIRAMLPASPPRHAGGASASERPSSPASTAPRGLSVAAAGRASSIAFQPLRMLAPRTTVSDDPEPPAAAAPPPPEPLPPEPPRRPHAAAQHQRFARTVADLERYLAASREREPGRNAVPRPPLPLADEQPSGLDWLRPWSRRGR